MKESLFSSVGEKFNTAIQYIPETTEVVTLSDVDDIFFYNHLKEGIGGIIRANETGRVAYKPKMSFCDSYGNIILNENVYEPSIFFPYEWLKEYGFHNNSVKFSDKWLFPLVEQNKILSDPTGVPTFCYDWSGEMGGIQNEWKT